MELYWETLKMQWAVCGVCMSKGPGAVERKLRDIFVKEPKGVFTTEVLCRRVYQVKKVQKKHRVAVLRALKRLAIRSMPTLWRRVQKHERDDAWYDYRSFPSRTDDRAFAIERRPRKR
jgi:hypothetical protein